MNVGVFVGVTIAVVATLMAVQTTARYPLALGLDLVFAVSVALLVTVMLPA